MIEDNDYVAANALLEGNVQNLVKNASIAPNWLGDIGSFWYEREGEQGKEYRIVDTTSGESRTLADTADLVEAIGIDLAEENEPPPPGALPSNTGKYSLKALNHNLLLAEIETGMETQLTHDGEAYKSWGKLPDTGLMVIPAKKTGMQMPPIGTEFSPDDKFLVAALNDERNVSVMPFVEWVPTDGTLRPIVHEVRHPHTGDSDQTISTLWSFHLESGNRVQIQLPEDFRFGGLDGNVLGWSVERGQAFIVARTIGSKRLSLFSTDLTTGESRALIEEVAETHAMSNTVEYNKGNFRVIGDGAEVIWYSDREGSGHLYLYDGQTGELKNSITSGNWLVQDIHEVDEARREIYFTAGAREAGRDPYYRNLYRASFDGGEITLLTEEDADHFFPPDMTDMFVMLFSIPRPASLINTSQDVFIDTWSTVDTPPVTALRSTRDGSLICILEEADASALYEAGWLAPVRQAVKAADGETDIYTVYFPPKKSLPNDKHPVIDAVYGGPQVIVAPRNFMEAVMARNPIGRHALTRLGFAVVTTDGRGTPLRDNAFRDAGYVEFTRVGIEDHMAAINQLADKYPEMDTSRVGIYGWSWGGTFTAQAMLSQPDFYHAGITGAGVYDYAALYPGFEANTGVPKYADDGQIRTRPDEKPYNFEKLDITRLAGNLKGKMLIIYGDMDENVPQNQAFRLIDALIKANKPYDLMYLPNRPHSGVTDNYVIQRQLDYFVEHLLGVEPPTGVDIDSPPVSMM